MEITKEEFKRLYFSMTNEALAKKLNVSKATLIGYAKKLDLHKSTGGSPTGNQPKVKII